MATHTASATIIPVFTPQWPQYLCRWFCLLALVFAQTTSSASNDYRTRRIGITETGGAGEGGTLAEPKHTAVVFAGGLSLAEYESASPQTAVSNPQSTTVHYTRGPEMGGGVGGLLYTNRGGATKFNLSNGRGDIVAQSDAAGALTWTASYEAYGKRTKETGANADKQRANTKDEDPTGLLNEGQRYRDLETGVFISRDPAGFVDGPNLYAYVKQNPWSKFDPNGLAGKSPKAPKVRPRTWNDARAYPKTYLRKLKLLTPPLHSRGEGLCCWSRLTLKTWFWDSF